MLLTTFPGNSAFLRHFPERFKYRDSADDPGTAAGRLRAPRGRPARRGAAALWPDTTLRRAAAYLRSALWRLVKPAQALVLVRVGALDLGQDAEADVRVVRRFADRLAEPPRAETPESPPLASLTAELLPGWTDPWVTDERDWFRQLCLRTLETLSTHLHARGDTFHAHEAAAAAVRGDPLRESAHRRLIELHLADGNPAAALRQYAAYRSRLRDSCA